MLESRIPTRLLVKRQRNESSVPQTFVYGTVKGAQLFSKNISCPD